MRRNGAGRGRGRTESSAPYERDVEDAVPYGRDVEGGVPYGMGFRACGRGERIPTPVTSVTGSE